MTAQRGCELARGFAHANDQCGTLITFVRFSASQKPFRPEPAGRDKNGTQKPIEQRNRARQARAAVEFHQEHQRNPEQRGNGRSLKNRPDRTFRQIANNGAVEPEANEDRDCQNGRDENQERLPLVRHENETEPDDECDIGTQQQQSTVAQHQDDLFAGAGQKRQSLPWIFQTHTRIIPLSHGEKYQNDSSAIRLFILLLGTKN